MTDKLTRLKCPCFGMFTTYLTPCEICGEPGHNYVHPENNTDYCELNELLAANTSNKFAIWNTWWRENTMHLCDVHKEIWYTINKMPFKSI
jgi:hypothetical protein